MASRRFAVVVNPASGRRRGRQVLGQVHPLFKAAGVRLDICLCERPRHALQFCRDLDLSLYDGCCVIGGDGTVHEVVNGLLWQQSTIPFPLGLIPAGSGNTLHLHQGIRDPVEAVRKIIAGSVCPLDVARVTMPDETVYCINIVGWAAVVDINRFAERLRFMGPARYGAATLGFICRPRRRPARLVLDDRVYDDEFMFVLGCNTKFTGNGMLPAPNADLHDGKIDVLIVRNAARWQLLQLFVRIFSGSHLALPFVEYHRVRHFAIENDDQQPLDLDGEATGKAPFSVKMVSDAIRIFT